jgi:hypothetical protein
VEERLQRAFALTLCRPASAKEMAILRGYYRSMATGFLNDPTSAKPLLNSALTASGESPATAAALVCVARTLFNTDNFITRE